ncbi:MAG TPA: protein translocase subunit SecDF [Bacteroidia bacterium]|nr:protein translocase subunit SecDF [Bacteroidia bacterium]HNT79966.1 protein translocase subunit SecDF [Bacteroidia bacterium]
MQNKGTIRWFAILLALVCIYQLSFTVAVKMKESKAKDYAAGDPVKEREYLDSIANVPSYNLLFKNYTFLECKERELNLGLDLKGGMNVTMEVSVVDLIKSMANFSTDPTFNKALADAQQMQKNSQEDFVTLFGRAFSQADPNAKLAAIFNTMDLQGRVNFNSTNEEVIAVIREEADAAIDRTFNILRTRIDKFGVTQPNIQQLGSGRILVELPGVKEPDRVRKLLQGTARLEFWETHENAEITETYFTKINERLRNLNQLGGSTSETFDVADTSLTALAAGDSLNPVIAATDSAADGFDDLVSQVQNDTTPKDTSAAATFEDFAKENPLFAVLAPSIFQNAQGQSEYRQGPVVGYALIKDTGKVNRIFDRPEIKELLPKNLKLLWGVKPPTPESSALELVAIKVSSRDGQSSLEGDMVVDARQDFGQLNSNPEVTMRMNAEGAKIWKRLTSENVGKSIAIVLDNYVYSYPTVQGEIAGGNSSISGNFTINEAKDLANILKAGKLPAPAKIVEEAVVGPSLGKESINSSLLSFVIALLLVLAFMVFYYNNAGWAANLALFANIFFIFGVLASLGAVLTLPGIAGIVLTLGMAVDANILIYERVREEIANGKGGRLAIADGFKAAYSSIIDANVTTLLTGIVLYVFGSGPIQGFATTLIIGILTTLFTAIFITRLIFEAWLGKNKEIKFATKISEGAFKNLNIDFVSKRKFFYFLSTTIIAVGIGFMIFRGFNLGVDFKGGRTYVVRFDEAVSTLDIRSKLTGSFASAPEVKTFGSSNQVKITTTYLIDDNSEDADQKVEQALREGLSIDAAQIMSSQKVGPTVADDIKVSALWSLVIAVFIIFLYIILRFRRWTFGLGATVALLHDTLIVISLFSMLWGILPFSLEIDQAFIAAILTVMGYSLNDTVVVFDRIREYLGIHHKGEMEKVVNDALNSTLSRTINTSLTIFFVLLAIFIFGGEVIRGFTFAMLMGVIVGTYSSLYVATPIVIDFSKKKNSK